jgi:hypothetical protein
MRFSAGRSPELDDGRTRFQDSLQSDREYPRRGDLNVVLPGYLMDSDDFNDQRPPYTFVRPGGRAGSCFANSYRSGGQFLLVLKETKGGELTVNWYALGPMNEQLHSDHDPWLLWVREHAHRVERVADAGSKPAVQK